ncbi:hypothetical protein [Malacoplasma iowae]|uniref:hypothetical protein n=1 Tax=Malacoplasma iowae TaxID=2116 RepID=UPI003872D7DB|nr:hypothetical protein QX181_00720 [Malacoplasma iowae]
MSYVFYEFNPKSHGVEATIFWIKENYPLEYLDESIARFEIQRRDCLRRKYVKGKRRKIGIFSKIDGAFLIV